jgi:hypothetical protein
MRVSDLESLKANGDGERGKEWRIEMSDTSEGLGWWEASDGKWYPPETHPNYRQQSQEPKSTPNQPVRSGAGLFAILNVEPEGTPPSDLFPGPGPSPNTVVLEPADGPAVYPITASGLSVGVPAHSGRPAKQVLRLKDLQVSVIVTDCRVAVACSNYDKGGGWYPVVGLAAGAIALTANAVSKSRAKKRRVGNMIVGQVRYSWLKAVAFQERTGWVGAINNVRLLIAYPQVGGTVGPTLTLEIAVPKGPTGAMAHDIVRRASTFRLADDNGQMTPEMRRRAEELVHDAPLEPVREGYAVYNLLSSPQGSAN